MVANGMKIITYDNDSAMAAAKQAQSPIGTQEAQNRIQANALGAGLELTTDEMMCAMLEAMKLSLVEIEDQTGWPLSWIFALRLKYDYREMVRRCIELVAEQTANNASVNIDQLFNSQIRPSVRTLIEVRDNPFTKAGDRIKAAGEFLDRAPDSPKVRQIREGHQTIISLPVSTLRNMQRALLESGSDEDLEVHDLLEGRDFETVDAAESDELIAIEIK